MYPDDRILLLKVNGWSFTVGLPPRPLVPPEGCGLGWAGKREGDCSIECPLKGQLDNYRLIHVPIVLNRIMYTYNMYTLDVHVHAHVLYSANNDTPQFMDDFFNPNCSNSVQNHP